MFANKAFPDVSVEAFLLFITEPAQDMLCTSALKAVIVAQGNS